MLTRVRSKAAHDSNRRRTATKVFRALVIVRVSFSGNSCTYATFRGDLTCTESGWRNVAARAVVLTTIRELRTCSPARRAERISVVVAAEHRVDPDSLSTGTKSSLRWTLRAFCLRHGRENAELDDPRADAKRNSSERTALFSHSHSSVR